MSNNTQVMFTPKAEEGYLCLNGAFTQAAILELRDAIQEAADYWRYDHLVLEINSPGGELLALKALMHEARQWRLRGGTFKTVGLMQVASAAAITLSLGDMGTRTVHPYTHLLYHHARVSGEGRYTLTAIDAEASQKKLRQADRQMMSTLVQHIAMGLGGVATMAHIGLSRCEWLRQHAAAIANELGDTEGLCANFRQGPKQPTPLVLKQMERAYQKAADQNQADPMIEILAAIFERDERMPLDMAWGLLLIDNVAGAVHLQPMVEIEPKSHAKPRVA
jgi:ATP-dependent protease ClpP protease subunit